MDEVDLQLEKIDLYDTNPQELTLRDYFAAHAPAKPEDYYVTTEDGIQTRAELHAAWRFEFADAMMKARMS